MDIPKAPQIQEPPAEQSDKNVIQEEDLCPICGYFVGSLETCVRCGARVEKKLSVKLIKRIAIYGSIIGVVLLWIAAYAKKPQQVNVADINALMNGALVKIVGTVNSVDINEEKNSLRIEIDDGTGKIRANAYNKLRQFRKVLGENMPQTGDKIEVVGTINVSQRFGAGMFLSVPDRVKVLEKFKAELKNIGELSPQDKNNIFLIHCWISDYNIITTKRGSVLYKYTLTDKTGSIETVLPEWKFNKLSNKQKRIFEKWGYYKLELLVKAYMDNYTKKLQVDIVDFSRIKKLAKLSKKSRMRIRKSHKTSPGEKSFAKPERVPFSDLKNSDIGRFIEVDAKVRFISQKSKGTLLTLDDGTGSLKVMVWDDVGANIKGFEYIGRGDRIQGVFKVDEYKGKLQLKIFNPNKIKIIQK